VAGITLVAGFGFMGVAPFIADYVIMVGGLCGLVYGLRSGDQQLHSPIALSLYAALALLSVTLPFVYNDLADLLPFLACLPILAAPGIAVLLNGQAYWLQPARAAWLCLAGVALGTMLGMGETLLTGTDRAGVGNNPIHYAGILTVLGFFGLLGAVTGTSRARLIFLMSPLLALVGVVLSGSRGPLLAWLALGVATLPLVLISLRDRRLTFAVLGMVLIGGATFALVAKDSLLVQRIVGTTMNAVASGALPADILEAQDPHRVALYGTGWHAFLSSPIVGVGFGQVMPMAQELFPELEHLRTLENLHSDLADFAAMAGLMGIASLLLLLLAPLLAIGKHWRRNLAVTVAALTLTIGYAVLGLTNAMFGVLPQTALYAAGLGYLMALSRDAERSKHVIDRTRAADALPADRSEP
jgi:O-antigen ligase